MQRLGKVREGSGADAEARIRKVPVQGLGEVPEGFRCRFLDQIAEGSGAEVR